MVYVPDNIPPKKDDPVGMGWPELARSLADLHRKCDWIRWHLAGWDRHDPPIKTDSGFEISMTRQPEPEWPER